MNGYHDYCCLRIKLQFTITKHIKMGGTQSSQIKTDYSSGLILVETIQNHNFGAIDIFSTKQPPYQYVMDFRKNFVQDKDRISKYFQFANQLKNIDHKNVAKIYHCQRSEETHVCIKHTKVHIFSSYYNFTLEEAIQKKKIQDCNFLESELIYIMGSLLEVGKYLKNYGISMGQYRSKSIYLSPEGYIKLYLLEIEQQNRHSCFFKVMCQRSQIQNYILSPEQLKLITQNNYQAKYDPFQADIFAIGMVVLELITLDKAKFYYNQSKTELKIDRIAFDISSIGNIYSEAFIHLLRCCLNPNPLKRCNFQQSLQQLNNIKKNAKSIVYCLRLQGDDERSKKNISKRDTTTSAKGAYILNGLNKKLTPSPISTLSNTTTSNFKAESKSNSSRISEVVSVKR